MTKFSTLQTKLGLRFSLRKEGTTVSPSLDLFEDWKEGFSLVAGVDEAGRGPLAGPVVAAACIIPESLVIQRVRDSKTISEKERKLLYCTLTRNQKVTWAVGIIDHEMIDAINILQATLLAMKQAVEALTLTPELVVVDGNTKPSLSIPCRAYVKGDSTIYSISAASIIAKVTRDRIMEEYHKTWPQYGFKKHKGYPTKEHIAAIEKYGLCPIHRRSFQPCCDTNHCLALEKKLFSESFTSKAIGSKSTPCSSKNSRQ